MRVHHLNCISTCPIGGRLMDESPRSIVQRGRLASHCLAIETNDGLVLVDTGLGLRDVAAPRTRISRFFLALVKPEFRAEMTARRQLERLGFDAEDVRHIVLTHLDFDHVGGLDDFPNARIHLLREELDSASEQRTLLDRMRYRPAQWSSVERWSSYVRGEGEPWFGFDAVRGLDGMPPEILMVPLIGHTLGHTGVAVLSDRGWLLDAGDAYFFHAELDLLNPRCTPGLRAYQTMMEKDRTSRRWNQARLRALKHRHGHELTIFCSHDTREFERLAGHSAELPADVMEEPLLLQPGEEPLRPT